MLAARFYGAGDLRLVTLPDPHPGPGELVIRIDTTGLSATDLRLLATADAGPITPGVVLGHEIAGRIAEIGEGVHGYQVGQQATVSRIVSCHACAPCRDGLEQLCENRLVFGRTLDGGFADYVLVPARAVAAGNVITPPVDLPSQDLSLADPLSRVIYAQSVTGVRPGDTIVVLGGGPRSILHVAMARRSGARDVVLVSPSVGRASIAGHLGATRGIDPTHDDAEAAIADLTKGRGADSVFVAYGAGDLAAVALRLARVGGQVCYFTGFRPASRAAIDPGLIQTRALTVTGGVSSRRRDMVRAVELLAAHALGDLPGALVKTYPLSDIDAAIESVRDKKSLKIALQPGRAK